MTLLLADVARELLLEAVLVQVLMTAATKALIRRSWLKGVVSWLLLLLQILAAS